MEIPEHPTMEFADGVRFGVELVMNGQTRTIREVLTEVEGVSDDGQITVGSVKEMLQAFVRTNQEILADVDETLSTILSKPDNDPREGDEDE